MEKSKENKIKWIFFKNRLKNVYRTGWLELGVEKDQVESVADHIASTSSLINSYNEQYDLKLDINKVDKMLLMKEIVKAYTKEEKSVINGENTNEINRNIIIQICKDYNLDSSYLTIYDEYIKQETSEAKYSLMFSKFESDLQAVDYYERGLITLDSVLKDIEFYPEELKNNVKSMLEKYPIPPLAWLTYDRKYYKDNELLTSLSDSLIEYCINQYKKDNSIINEKNMEVKLK